MRRMIDIFLSAMLILGGSAWSMDDWTQKFPVPNPGQLSLHSLCYVGADRVLLFGGKTAGGDLNGKTWIYDLSNNTWTDREPATSPVPRQLAAMAYVGPDQAVLFGGKSNGTDFGVTYEYDYSSNTWTAIAAAPAPSARYNTAMAFIGGQKALLFGGSVLGNRNDETWLYDAGSNSWTQLSPSVSPPSRWAHDLAYIGDDRVLLFGGDVAGAYDDTWIFDLSGNNWTQKSPITKPDAAVGHKMAYLGGDRVLLFGSLSGSDISWVYDLSSDSWSQDANTTAPAARCDHGLAETSMNGSSYLVLFGGLVSLSWNGDTWTFGGGDFSLPVELASFAAEAGDSQVKLIWTTQSEIDCAGFNIYRAAEPDGERQRLNPRLIPGAGTSTQPHDYDYTDYQANNGQTYFYYLENQDYSGLTVFYGPIEATPMAASSGGIPTAFALQANFPNPFNPGTWLAYDLPSECEVELAVFTLLGARVRTLVQEVQKGDSHLLYWNGMDDRGANLPSGIYLVQLKTPAFSQTRKVTLVR